MTPEYIDDPAELAAHYGLSWPADACRCCGARVIDGTCLSYESATANAGRPADCTCPRADVGEP